MKINVSCVTAEQRPAALRLLFARFPVEEQETRLSDALQAVSEGRLNLDAMFLAEQEGTPVGVTLTMHQRDQVSLVWPPVLTCRAHDPTMVEDALLEALCREIDRAGSKLAQALIAPDDDHETAMLLRHGFEHRTDLFFMARTLTADDWGTFDATEAVDHELFCDANATRYAATIDQTYRQSLDCPFLEGFRSGTEAIVSHRLSGVFDPAGWRLYRVGEKDVGVVLLNEHPEQNAIELVYFGVVPEFRGRGFGRRLLADAIAAAALTGRAVLFLAVDCANSYANALYGQQGFSELARRRIVVRRTS